MADEANAKSKSASPEADASKVAATDNHQEGPGSDVGDEVAPSPTRDAKSTSPSKADPAEPESTADEPATKDDEGVTTEHKPSDGLDDDAAAQQTAQTATPSTASKNKKRKSSSGVPEHKSKKLNRKKSMPNLHLDVESGQYWFARMKGHPSWPAIVCDEEMLPESLLIKRPVSAWRPDGSYRADFEANGKNIRDRRYPVMFLGTNEFYWIVNTDLEPLDMDEVKQLVEKDDRGKKGKALWDAYQIAAEDNDLDHFKSMLVEHEHARIREAQEKAEKESKKKAKKEKATKAKAEEDVEMEDAVPEDSKPKKTASKKRKKEPESDGEAPKAAKTPKTKLKVNGPKAPVDTKTSKPKKLTKNKKVKAEEEAEGPPAKPAAEPRFEDPAMELRFKRMYHFRTILQKGFLTEPPKEDAMEHLDQAMTQVEKTSDVEGAIIRESRLHRVLKNILKLPSIPRDEEFNFKQRSISVLQKLNKILAADAEATGQTAGVPKKADAAANGVEQTKKNGETASTGADAKMNEELKEESPKDPSPSVEAEAAPAPEKSAAVDKSGEEDVTMEDVKDEENKEGVPVAA